MPNNSLIARDSTKKTITPGLFPKNENRPEWYDPTSSLFFDLVNAGTLPHYAAWLVHNRRKGRRKNGSVMLGKTVNPPIITIKTAHTLSSLTDDQDGIKIGFYKKSVMIRDISSGVHSCD